jgi:hypothetical protein
MRRAAQAAARAGAMMLAAMTERVAGRCRARARPPYVSCSRSLRAASARASIAANAKPPPTETRATAASAGSATGGDPGARAAPGPASAG